MQVCAMSEPKHTTESVRYEFTRSELYELGQKLARQTAQVFDLERQKKDVMKSLGAAIEHANLAVKVTTEKINGGYEMRDMDCLIVLNTPRSGVKSITRADTGEIVREENMTPEEMQRALPFDPERAN
jgi:hypothetical protein